MIIKLILLISLSSYAALDARYDDYDSFELVQVLIDDGKLDLARKELDGLSREEKRDARFDLLNGVISYKKSLYADSIDPLKRAAFAVQSENAKVRDLYLGRAYYFLERNELCAKTFKNGIQSSLAKDEDTIFYATCERRNQSADKAWALLSAAIKRAPTLALLQAASELLLSEKLANVAKDINLQWLALYSKQSSDFIAVAEIFNKHKDTDGRLAVLEMGRVKHPLDLDLNLHLNQIYYEKGMLLAVEEGFARATQVDSKYAYHAAEINRQVGRYERSQFFNASIPDERERLKQKLAIYVDKGQFALIASMEPALQRTSLINDDEVRYALAYSLVRSGQYTRPMQYLAKITNKDFLEKTVLLRNALAECVEKNTSCKL